MVSTADRLRPVPAALTREGDVLAALDRLAKLGTTGNPDEASVLPASGLLAMSIPAGFGGADISNLIVAEAVSRLMAFSTAAAERLLRHLVALELVRTSGSTEQRKAIYGRVVLGDVFALAVRDDGAALPKLVPSGLAFALERSGSALAHASADWQIVIASGAGSEPMAAILEQARLSLRDEQAASDVIVQPEGILSLGAHAEHLARLMMAFLLAAAARGQMGATMMTVTDQALAVELELLDAMIQKAASLIDGIQVDDAPIDLAQVDLVRRALDTARLRSLRDHSPAISS